MKYLTFLRNYLLKELQCREVELSTEANILSIERKLNIKFPESFRELMLMKSHYGQILLGDKQYRFDEYPALRQQAQQLMDMFGYGYRLTENDFVFMFVDGWIVYFFRLDEGDNPPVYMYREGESIVKIREHLSEFVRMDVYGDLTAYADDKDNI